MAYVILNSLNSCKALAVLYSFKNIANANLLKFLAAQPYKAIQLGGLYSWGVNSSRRKKKSLGGQQQPQYLVDFPSTFKCPGSCFKLSLGGS